MTQKDKEILIPKSKNDTIVLASPFHSGTSRFHPRLHVFPFYPDWETNIFSKEQNLKDAGRHLTKQVKSHNFLDT